MSGVFARRRARLLAMKALRSDQRQLPPEPQVTCPHCGQDSARREVVQALSVCPRCGYHWPIGAYYRLSTVLDAGSFRELNEDFAAADPLSFPGYSEKLAQAQKKTGISEAVVTATGAIGGVRCVVGVMDSRFFMGSMSAAVGEKITLAIEHATKNKLPLILLCASGGARIQEGVHSLIGFGRIFRNNTLASGVIPQISAIMGPCAGGAVYSPAITDYILMVNGTSNMFITGPDVVKTVVGEQVTAESLGGAFVHSSKSGVSQFIAVDDADCIRKIRRLLSYLPDNYRGTVPVCKTIDKPDRLAEKLDSIIPDDPRKSYDMYTVIHEIVDIGSFFEVSQGFA